MYLSQRSFISSKVIVQIYTYTQTHPLTGQITLPGPLTSSVQRQNAKLLNVYLCSVRAIQNVTLLTWGILLLLFMAALCNMAGHIYFHFVDSSSSSSCFLSPRSTFGHTPINGRQISMRRRPNQHLWRTAKNCGRPISQLISRLVRVYRFRRFFVHFVSLVNSVRC